MANKMEDLLTKPGNNRCGDCHSLNVEFTSGMFGVFLCKKCAAIHRTIPGNNVKCLAQDAYSGDEISFMESMGNAKVRARLEANLPDFYLRPSPDCKASCLREEFIRAKYVRHEFEKGNETSQRCYNAFTKTGKLQKRLRDENKFVDRPFELNMQKNYLRYFNKPDAKEPKASLDLEKLNVTFIHEESFRVPKNTMLINYNQEGATRFLFVCGENSKDIVDWYNAIRCCKLHRACLSLTGMGQDFSIGDIAEKLTYDYLTHGWLEKTGPRPGDAWRKRWATLGRRKLTYSDDSVSPFAKGEIFIGLREKGYGVESGAPENWKHHSGFAFTLITPERRFVFLSNEREDRDTWVRAINYVLEQPISLLEMKEAAAVVSKK